jgi:hypothetical protein
MSETAKKLFEGLKAMAPGLKDVVHETGAEMKRLGVQGSAELAAALFSGANSYVPDGRGQWQSKDQERAGQEQGGRER